MSSVAGYPRLVAMGRLIQPTAAIVGSVIPTAFNRGRTGTFVGLRKKLAVIA